MIKISKYLVAVLLLSSVLSAAEHKQEEKPEGCNCLFIGHSFFIPVAMNFKRLPGKAGIKKHHQVMVFSPARSGSPRGLWDGPKAVTIKNALKTGQVNLLAMTCFSMTDSAFDDYKRWIDIAVKANPKTKFLIAMPWNYLSTASLDKYSKQNHSDATRLYKEVLKLRKAYPDNKIDFINYGTAAIELLELYLAGKLPDVKRPVGRSADTIFQDGKGHASPILNDLSALMWLKVVYDIDPVESTLKWNYKTNINEIAGRLLADNRTIPLQDQKKKAEDKDKGNDNRQEDSINNENKK